MIVKRFPDGMLEEIEVGEAVHGGIYWCQYGFDDVRQDGFDEWFGEQIRTRFVKQDG